MSIIAPVIFLWKMNLNQNGSTLNFGRPFWLKWCFRFEHLLAAEGRAPVSRADPYLGGGEPSVWGVPPPHATRTLPTTQKTPTSPSIRPNSPDLVTQPRNHRHRRFRLPTSLGELVGEGEGGDPRLPEKVPPPPQPRPMSHPPGAQGHGPGWRGSGQGVRDTATGRLPSGRGRHSHASGGGGGGGGPPPFM